MCYVSAEGGQFNFALWHAIKVQRRGEQMYSYTLSLTSAQSGSECFTRRSGRLLPGNNPAPTGWASWSVWTRAGTVAPTGIRSPNCPTTSESLSRPNQSRVVLRVGLKVGRGKWQRDGENCVMRKLMICVFHRMWGIVQLACSSTFQCHWQAANGEWTDGLQAPGGSVCECGKKCRVAWGRGIVWQFRDC